MPVVPSLMMWVMASRYGMKLGNTTHDITENIQEHPMSSRVISTSRSAGMCWI
jgi:hypothetical protein